MPVNSVHADLFDLLPMYETISDCLAGEPRIKFRREKYLPRPNPNDTSDANRERYTAYLTRAVFYNVTKRTLGGLIGQIYSRAPIIEIPDMMNVVKDDATGLGVDITQLSKSGATFAVGYGRGGLFVDYPDVADRAASKAEIDAGNIRPMFQVYDPKNVINWRYEKRGGKQYLTLVVLQERKVKTDDGFYQTFENQWRVLRLEDGGYTQRLYTNARQNNPQVFEPKDSDGNRFQEIPFEFMGSESNDPNPNSPPIYDLASLNIGHYRNSADYEESAYIVGQPTPYFAGLTEQWVKQVLKGTIQLGARAAVPLPVGASAGLLQAQPNSLAFEAMTHKEKQMIALGAKLVEPNQVVRTATEAGIDYSYETSTLSSSADNVSDAFTRGLRWAAQFMGAPDRDKIKFELNTEFDLIKMSSNERAQLVSEWQSGAITFGELRANMRRAGIATLEDKEAQAQIEEDMAKLPGLQLNKPANSNDPNNPQPSKQPAKPGTAPTGKSPATANA
jgi:hypothetical protein